MKAHINIELWDDTTEEQLNAAGFTLDFLKNGYKNAFDNILKQAVAEGCEYSISVEVET